MRNHLPRVARIAMTDWSGPPTAFDGLMADGRYVHVRFRRDVLRIGFGPTVDDAARAAYRERAWPWVRPHLTGTPSNGALEFDALRRATRGCLDWRGSVYEGFAYGGFRP